MFAQLSPLALINKQLITQPTTNALGKVVKYYLYCRRVYTEYITEEEVRDELTRYLH